jgi:hypothetical protein
MTTNEGKEKTMALKGFRKGLGNNSTYICSSCKHNTRNVGGDEAILSLCERCYDEAGRDNAHSDGHHDAEKDMECLACNPAVKSVIEQRKLEAQGKQAVSPAPKSLSGKETTMATNVKAEVAKLVKKLIALKDKSDAEGRAIRRTLRKLGHKGGTGKGPGRPAKAKPAKKAKKAAKKVAPAPAPVTPATI